MKFPIFINDVDAVMYGKNATPEEVDVLRMAYRMQCDAYVALEKRCNADPDNDQLLDNLCTLATKHQNYRHAILSAEGKLNDRGEHL